ncbi:MAG: SDR family NAD(P)-dependent oxidoreductase [Elainella sp.]
MGIAIDLAGQVVLITGASQGIGATTALTLAQAGADIVLHYGSSRAKAEGVAAQINSLANATTTHPNSPVQRQG